MTMNDIEGRALPDGTQPLSDGDRRWLQTVEVDELSPIDIGRVRAMADRGTPADRKVAERLVAAWHAAHPPEAQQRPVPPSIKDSGGAALGRTQREAAEAAAASRKGPIEGLHTIEEIYGPEAQQ